MLKKAIRQLSSAGHIIASSSLYETAPWGFEAKENFLNRVVIFETDLPPLAFLKSCLETEKQLGRTRLPNGPRYASRPIDIDLLFYDSLILDTPELILPHPGWLNATLSWSRCQKSYRTSFIRNFIKPSANSQQNAPIPYR